MTGRPRKVMLLGEIGVGKSSLIRRLVLGKFEFDYKPTLGVNIYTYDVPRDVVAEATTLVVWDTDGNLGGAIFDHIYMRQASAAVIIGDLTRPGTLESMQGLAKGFAEAFPGRHFALIANKADLLAQADQVTRCQPLQSFASDNGTDLTVTSAKTGQNVANAFNNAAISIVRRDP
jgi:Ras-related protein Rab-22